MNAGSGLTFREADPSDAAAVAALSAELGYAVPVGEMDKRLQHVADDPLHAVIVACGPDGAIIGWADVGMTFHLQSGHYAEIGGLVVTEAARGSGIGRELVRAAEQWAAFGGAKRMLVRSNVVREGAHRFYLREGYERSKTSAVFEKPLE
jgi:(aminoalkyl)phosphonate N-acetyltransferase